MGAIEPVLQFCLILAACLLTLGFLIEFGIFFAQRFRSSSGESTSDEPISVSPDRTAHKLMGERGEVVSMLRPAGIARLRGDRVQVVARYDFIDEGVTVRVTHVEGNQIYVEADADDPTD